MCLLIIRISLRYKREQEEMTKHELQEDKIYGCQQNGQQNMLITILTNKIQACTKVSVCKVGF